MAGAYKLRFYEEDPSVKFSIEFLFTFPQSVQTIIARGFGQIAVRDYKAQQVLNNTKSLGKEKILALYALRQKRRTYDQNPTVHQAMGYMMVLPDDCRRGLAQRLSELSGFIYEYIKDCQLAGDIPQVEILDNLTDLYVREGSVYVSQFLKLLRTKLEAAATAAKSLKPNPTPTSHLELIKDAGSGLSVKEE
jgi:hypothetical protein